VNAFVPSIAGTRPATAHHMFANNPNHRDDWLDSFYLQSTSQVDGLRHIRAPQYGFYNGIPDSEISLAWPDKPALGVQLLAEQGIASRGVLLDAKRHFEGRGEEWRLDRPRYLTPEDLDSIAEAEGVEIRPGDLLLLHVGWSKWWLTAGDDERRGRSGTPGIAQSFEMLEWIWDHQIAMFAADNSGLEANPKLEGTGLHLADDPLPERGPNHNGGLHRHLLPMLGLIVGELWLLDDLAADCADDGVYEFMVTCSPLNVIGGVGAPSNAIAIK
jgi:kynurenine formamidase